MSLRPSVNTALRALLGMVCIAGISAGCNSSDSKTSVTGPSSNDGLVTIFINNGVFSPNPLPVKVGAQVNWKNNDSIAHTATLDGVFDTGSIPPTSAHDVAVTMNVVGTFTYHCTLHTGEIGSIVVQQ